MNMTPAEARIRGATYMGIAAIAAILSNDYLKSHIPALIQASMEVIGAVLGAYRIYIDQSPAQSKMQTKVECETVSAPAIDEN